MKVAGDRCPEDLFARSRRGPLSLVEQRALDAHLGVCGLCRGAMLLATLFDDVADETEAEVECRTARLATRVAYKRTRPRRVFARTLGFVFGAVVLVVAGVAGAWVMARRADASRRAQELGSSGRAHAPAEVLRREPPPASVSPPPPPGTPALPPVLGPALVLPAPDAPAIDAVPVAVSASQRSSARRRGPPAVQPSLRSIAEAGDAPSVDAQPAAGPGALFVAANAARRAGALSQAVEQYRELQRRFPGSEEARLSFFSAGDVLVRVGEPAPALAQFDRYLEALPSGSLAAEARFGRARCLEALGRREEAAEAWRRLLRDFPRSIYEGAAQRRLSELERR